MALARRTAEHILGEPLGESDAPVPAGRTA
jgi:hypothetical protein